MAITFKGWSTAQVTPTNTNVNFYDIELVKQDLLNEFMTKKGERVMMPDYGSITWFMLFEPLIDANVSDIVSDTEEIIASEPRVTYVDCFVDTGENSITLYINLIYNPTMTPFELQVFFDNKISSN